MSQAPNKDRQRIEVPADNYGRAYIGLLETTISADAKLCYAVMWSFGSTAWCSVPSIARRMSRSTNTVRKSQEELAGAGWIKELENTPGGTRRWQMVPPKSELLAPGQAGLPLQGVKGVTVQTPSPGEGVPLHGVKPKKEVQPRKTQSVDFWVTGIFLPKWSEKTSQPPHHYKHTKEEEKAIIQLRAQGITDEIFSAKVDAYLQLDDKFVADMNWSLGCLFKWRWNSINVAAPSGPGNKPRLAI